MGLNVRQSIPFFFIKYYKGRNHDGVNARCGIVSHCLQEENLFSHSKGIVPEVFVQEIQGTFPIAYVP